MANHAFVTSYKHFKADQIEEDIKEILSRRFNNKVGYTRQKDYFEIGFGDEPGYPFSFSMWIATRRKLEFRHPFGDWTGWIFCVIQNELACKYGGLISDEGVCEKWKGETNKYPTFKNYLKNIYRNVPGMLRYAMERASIPKGWKS